MGVLDNPAFYTGISLLLMSFIIAPASGYGLATQSENKKGNLYKFATAGLIIGILFFLIGLPLLIYGNKPEVAQVAPKVVTGMRYQRLTNDSQNLGNLLQLARTKGYASIENLMKTLPNKPT